MNWDYVAGFFDGEGNLHVGLINKKAYQLLIRLYSTNKEVLEKIREFIKIGNIHEKTYSSRNPTWKPLYALTISKKEHCLLFLQNVSLSSVLKKDQINYLLENFDFLRGNKGSEGGHNNIYFDINKFRSFNTRAHTSNFIKNYTIVRSTE